jgi:hypothetical protein
VAAVLIGLIAPPGTRAAALAGPRTLVGPTNSLVSLGGMSIARDGSGGLVFVSKLGGVAHVFASRLIGGVFQAPEQLDAGLAGASSQPVIAAGNGGVVLTAFVNGGELYVADAANQSSPFGAAQPLYAQAQNPTIEMSNFGKGYLAFAAAENGGSDVRTAYYVAGRWANATGPVNVTVGDDAGTGSGRPDVATAGDGIGIVTWGEQGHVYARRLSGVNPSVETEQIDPASFGGAAETGADSPAVSVGGDSSYFDVVFDSHLSVAGHTQTRALLTRQIAENTQSPTAIDGSPTASQSAGQPAIAMNEYGRGFATAANLTTNVPLATYLTGNGQPAGGPAAIDSSTNPAPPFAVPALAGLTSTLIAYQESDFTGVPEIDLRYAQNGASLGLPMTVSSPSGGGADAAAGLAAGGDVNGDAAVAWIEGTGGVLSLDTAQYYVGPGQPVMPYTLLYTRRAQPVLAWGAARDAWGPVTYSVTLDGAPVAQTTATSFIPAAPLPDGAHVWQVTATNPAGLTSTGPEVTVFVDTTPPRLRLAVSGRPRAGASLTLHVTGTDPPPQVVGAGASGIASTVISWGDRTTAKSPTNVRTARHVYRRSGLYRLSVRQLDEAGNATQIVRYLRILS